MTQVRLPEPFLHRATGQAVVMLRDASGKRRMVYLGKHGTKAAEQRYREVLARHLAGYDAAPEPPRASRWPSVAELVAGFLLWAEAYYVDEHGQPSRSLVNFDLAFRPFLDLLRDLPTDQLSTKQLRRVQRLLVASGRCCRTTINQRLNLIRQCIRWGVDEELVPAAVWHQVSSMRGLAIGRAGVREARVVEAVPWSMVEPILPHLPAPLRAAVLVQWESGARPSEVLQLRSGDIDRSGDVWFFRPAQHKGVWRGKARVVAFNAAAQEVLRPLLKADPRAYLVSPRDAVAEQRAAKRAQRRTPPTKQMRDRDARAVSPEQQFGERYDVATYRRAIHRACDRAGVERWSPHRLRHAAGTRAFLQAGLEATATLLGHADVRTAKRYSEAGKVAKLADVVRRLG